MFTSAPSLLLASVMAFTNQSAPAPESNNATIHLAGLERIDPCHHFAKAIETMEKLAAGALEVDYASTAARDRSIVFQNPDNPSEKAYISGYGLNQLRQYYGDNFNSKVMEALPEDMQIKAIGLRLEAAKQGLSSNIGYCFIG